MYVHYATFEKNIFVRKSGIRWRQMSGLRENYASKWWADLHLQIPNDGWVICGLSHSAYFMILTCRHLRRNHLNFINLKSSLLCINKGNNRHPHGYEQFEVGQHGASNLSWSILPCLSLPLLICSSIQTCRVTVRNINPLHHFLERIYRKRFFLCAQLFL